MKLQNHKGGKKMSNVKCQMSNLKNGFTLLELLIVIAIIGILVSIGTVSYSSAQKKSRDAKRKSDLKAVQNAFEQYYADNNGNYSLSCTVPATYLPNGIPSDPKTGVSYATGATCTAASYCFCALLENPGTGNATNNTCTFGTGNYFCVKELQ